MADDHDDHDCCDDKGKDLVKLGPQGPEGFRPFIRHRSDCKIQQGFLRRPREGEPLMTGAIQLGPDQGDGIHEVIDEMPSMAPQERSGPAQVATDEYRTGWDSIFGKQTVGQA